MKKTKLSNIGDIQSGITTRTKVENDPTGEVAVIQMRDINNTFSGIANDCFKVKDNTFRERNLLQKGDLLFIAKGRNNYAIPYSGEYKNAVAVSFFFVIRLVEDINPYYLSWYINSPLAQRELEKGKEGTQTTNISKKTLGDLPIVVPTRQKQDLIAKIYALQLREATLLQEIKRKRSALVTEKLTDFLTNVIP